jgi:hypothetical protein
MKKSYGIIIAVIIIILGLVWYFRKYRGFASADQGSRKERFAYQFAGQFVQQANNATNNLGQTMQMAQQMSQGDQAGSVVERLQQLETTLNLVARMGYATFALLQSGGMMVSTAIRTVQGLRMMLERIVASINKITAIVYKYYKRIQAYFPKRQQSTRPIPVAYVAAPGQMCQAPFQPVSIQPLPQIDNSGLDNRLSAESRTLETEWNRLPNNLQARNRMSATDRLGRFLGKSMVAGVAQAIDSKSFPIMNKLYPKKNEDNFEDDVEIPEIKTPF